MLDDLIFKGKNLEESLSKASNFFGVPRESLTYESLEDAPEGEVWIHLTEHPLGESKQQEEEERPRGASDSQPTTHPTSQRPGQATRPHRQSNRVGDSGRGERSAGFSGARPKWQGNRQSGRGRGKPWKRKEPKLDGLGDAEKEAVKFVTDLLDGIQFNIDLMPVQDQSRLIFNLDGPDRNLLLVRKGSVLTSIQYLVNKIFLGREGMSQRIFVDSLGYRISREEELREIALMSADKVRSTKREYKLSPMNPYERRLIHVALKDDEDVTTISRGEGFIKCVSIILRSTDDSGAAITESTESADE